MTKVDIINRHAHCVSVSLCLLRDFFSTHLGAVPEELPEPLRGILTPRDLPYAFHRIALTSELAAAARSVLMAPSAVRRQSHYVQAKAVELTCLLIDAMTPGGSSPRPSASSRPRDRSQLQAARELLTLRYAEPLTLAGIAKEVGLNRMALTTGFKQLFGMSVYECLHKERMHRAFELLQDEAHSVTQIAEAVGYGHSCNFSTAFHSYFGCTPQQTRGAHG
jgi:AraC family transcriptional activator of pyochelin receptor